MICKRTSAYLQKFTYHVAPEDQGQTIERGYAMGDDEVVMRVIDWSEGSTFRDVEYFVADAHDHVETFEPWNRRPRIEREEWTKVSR